MLNCPGPRWQAKFPTSGADIAALLVPAPSCLAFDVHKDDRCKLGPGAQVPDSMNRACQRFGRYFCTIGELCKASLPRLNPSSIIPFFTIISISVSLLCLSSPPQSGLPLPIVSSFFPSRALTCIELSTRHFRSQAYLDTLAVGYCCSDTMVLRMLASPSRKRSYSDMGDGPPGSDTAPVSNSASAAAHETDPGLVYGWSSAPTVSTSFCPLCHDLLGSCGQGRRLGVSVNPGGKCHYLYACRPAKLS